MKVFFSILPLFLVLFSFSLFAQEKEEILEYHSEVEIQIDGSLNVIESIKVKSTGDQIKRGIFRSFPIVYRDKYNNRVKVGFEVHEVTRDGLSEPYQVIRQGDFEVVRIGNENTFLDPGIYDYRIAYTTNRQVGFFDDFDELYWNAIGAEWTFDIVKASSRIILPPGGEIKQFAAYAGPLGSTGCPCNIEKDGDGVLLVELNEKLNQQEALTVAVAWQKGIVSAPGVQEKTSNFISDNLALFILLIGIFLVSGYYYYAWKKVGRDPNRGGIYPIYEVPEGLDAAACRYLYNMKFDATIFAVSIIQMATREAIKIMEPKKRRYQLEKIQGKGESLSPIENTMLAALFPVSDTLHVNQKEHKKIGEALKILRKDLKVKYYGNYFKSNQTWLLPGIFFSIIAIFFAVRQRFEVLLEQEQGLLILGLIYVGIAVIFLQKVMVTYLNYLDRGYIKMGLLIGESLTAIILLGIPIIVILYFDAKFEYGTLLLIFILGLTNALFFYLMKAPTEEGRKLMDELEGFRMYLNAAEKPLVEHYNPPGITPEIFEKYLPYAIALGVGKAWGKAFENQLKNLYGKDNSQYHPAWYAGRGFQAASIAGFSQNLSQSFGGVLSNSSSPPGSKSGSGGGGSSGGGGGGGGGGGW